MDEISVVKTYNRLKAIEHLPFIAVDVETANKNPNSICQISIAWVEENTIRGLKFLVRPPTDFFEFTYIHGITYDMVKEHDPFHKLWDTVIKPVLKTNVLAAHYANFDMKAMQASYEVSGKAFNFSNIMVRDSCILSKLYFPMLQNHKLPTVCAHLKIELNHHDSLSDVIACADIVNFFMKNIINIGKYDMSFIAVTNDNIYKRIFFSIPTKKSLVKSHGNFSRPANKSAEGIMQNKLLVFILRGIIIIAFLVFMNKVFH